MTSNVFHDIRNNLAVAISSIEAFREGILEPSPARLSVVLHALNEIDVLLRKIPRETPTAGAAANEHTEH
ncbi:MAG: hypothetical protein JO164_11925 [Candidatus Eremiobacteraeota bacterium]|nr:hypothetical protein [Candidatus Eremiobacteraeota bacterium]